MNTNTLQSVQSNDTGLDNTVYFIGQDLHSNNVYVTVMVNQVREDGTSYGKVVASRRITLRKGQKEYIDFMSRFCEGKQHIAVVESTYNVYWMNDLFEERGWNLLIADPSTVSRDKTKACNDKTDATFLADTLRNGSCHVTRLLPSEVRYPRDLVRTRQTLIQQRARAKTIIKNLWMNIKGYPLTTKEMNQFLDEYVETDEVNEAFGGKYRSGPKARFYFEEIIFLTKEIEILEEEIKELVPLKGDVLRLMREMKGVGEVCARILITEIGDIRRFGSAGSFVSYCRLAPTAKLSNGKSKGMGNARNGNAYLSWCMTEVANLMVRYNEQARKCYERLLKRDTQHLRVKAIRSVAAKIARALWNVLSKSVCFDVERCFGTDAKNFSRKIAI